jgi:hypothetical protein
MEAHRINNLDFAKRQQVLEGDVDLPEMARLQSALVEGAALVVQAFVLGWQGVRNNIICLVCIWI